MVFSPYENPTHILTRCIQMKHVLFRTMTFVLLFLFFVSCSKNLKIEKIGIVPTGITSLVILNNDAYHVRQVRKSLIRRGFNIRPQASVVKITEKSETKDVQYNKSEEIYDVRISFLPSTNNPCSTNRGATHFNEVDFELIDLQTNRTLVFVSKGGRNETCPGSLVIVSTNTLFDDLASELAKLIQ